MSDGFYRAFEERYYAPREVIKSIRRQYLPFVKPLAKLYSGASTFDAGCGRGEWLELMSELGLSPFGVDLDEGMLSACIDLGLPAERGDAVSYIETLPSDSQVIVSAFHVVEHITFQQLQSLVTEALRVLKPGGLLIMETPNPENIVVATRNFYLDPTHQRPIPSMLLAFLAEYSGFFRVKTLRLQNSKDLVNKSDVTLQDVFAGVSPDYAVVAQKHASDDVLAMMSDAFSSDYGLSLENLLGRWDSRFDRLENRVQQSEINAQQWQSQAREWHERLLALHDSTSWRITRPLRVIKRLLSAGVVALLQSVVVVKLKSKKTMQPVVSFCIAYVLKRPLLRKILSVTLKCFPWLHQRLLRVGLNTGVFEGGDGDAVSKLLALKGRFKRGDVEMEILHMNPRAQQIYIDLEVAINNKKKENA